VSYQPGAVQDAIQGNRLWHVRECAAFRSKIEFSSCIISSSTKVEEFARRRHGRSGQRKLFPVRLVDMETLRDWECIDADTGEDLALEVRRYHIPDFSHWKEHGPFEAAFARLLKDLRAEEKAK
jgi:hypothetical protein